MHPATIQPGEIPTQWITLPYSSVPVLSFPMVAPNSIPPRHESVEPFLPPDAHPLPASLLFSNACSLLNSPASLIKPAVVCFQQLADSFCKMPRVGAGPPTLKP